MRLLGLARTGVLLAATVLFCAIDCATPTALTVAVYSEVACAKGATVALVGGGSLAGLATQAPSSASTGCTSEGAESLMGSVVLVPAGAKNESIAFAVMTRPDGQSPDTCLDPSQASACIVAKREITFIPHTQLDMRIDLRLSCLGIACAPDETCVKGVCVSAEVPSRACAGLCSESALAAGDGGATSDAGGDASIDAACDACGQPVVLASAQGNPGEIAVDATSVYWTTTNGFTVCKVAIDGGIVTTLASGQVTPHGIAVDGTSVYWTTFQTDGTISKVPLDGGAVTTLASGQNEPWRIAVDATSVYWTNNGGGTVNKAPIVGGSVVTLASGQDGASGIAVDGTSVYWSGGSGINKVPIGGGSIIVLAEGGGDNIAVDGTSVYWTTGQSGTVNKVPIGGGSVTVLASGQNNPVGVVVDATGVYWTNDTISGPGTIATVSPAGGSARILASGQVSPVSIVVDATNVYWTDYEGSGGVMTVAK